MPLKIYAGDTSQHAQVVAELTGTLGQAITDGQSGIFIVGGGPMVGKSNAVELVLRACDISDNSMVVMPRVDIIDDDITAANLITVFQGARELGENIFVLGQIPLQSTTTLGRLAKFYQQCLTDGRGPIQLIFNVVDKEKRPWMSQELRDKTKLVLDQIFKHGLHLFTLDINKEQVEREMWTLFQEGNFNVFNFVARELLLSTRSPEWEELISVETEEEFKQILDGMIEGGHRKTGLERKR